VGSWCVAISLPYELNGRFMAGISPAQMSQIGRLLPDWVLTPTQLTVTAALYLALNRGAKNHRMEAN